MSSRLSMAKVQAALRKGAAPAAAATRSAAQALGYRLSADGDSLLMRAETLP